jgi:hypothetical protein
MTLPGVKISALPAVSIPITGSELAPVVQNGVTNQATLSQILNVGSVQNYGAIGDAVTDDTAAFTALETANEGQTFDLRGLTYKVSSEPSKAVYYNGAFKIGSSYVYKDPTPWPTPFGRASIKTAISENDGHFGFNNGFVEAGSGTNSKWVMVYRRATSHGLEDGAQLWAADSYDYGQTWVNKRLIFRDAICDTRNFVVTKMAANRIGVIATRRQASTTYLDAVFVYSDDLGDTWSSANIISPTPGMAVNFHGAMLSYPTSVGGDDTNGFIAYSYGDNRSVDAFSTVNNGATWTITKAVAVPDVSVIGGAGVTYSLSEMGVARLGTENKWLMVLRNARPDGSSSSYAVAYTSTNLTTWSGPVSTGLLLLGNPPQLIYDSGRFWFFAFSRFNRAILPQYSSHILVASAPATALYNSGGNFAALNVGWDVLTSVPNWASGYFHPYKINNLWFGTFVCQEQIPGGTAGPKTNNLCVLGDFIPETVGATQVLSLVPQRNEVQNAAFQVWQYGTSFSATSTSEITTANNWTIACPSGQTINAQRQSFAVGEKLVSGDPKYYMQIYGTATTLGLTHYISTKIYGVNNLHNTLATLSFWAKSVLPIQQIRLIQNFGTGGTPSASVTTQIAASIATSNVWRKFTYTFAIPSISGKTLGTNNDDYLWLLFYAPENAAYTVELANVKLERGSVPSPFIAETENEVIAALGNTVSAAQTISSGVITVPSSANSFLQLIASEGGAATDDLDTINGGADAQIVVFMTTTSAQDITFKDNTGNLRLAGDFTLDTSSDTLTLIKRGTLWYEIARSNNA